MRALLTLTAANIRSFVRDRAALFWTIAFPITFVVLFGSIFSGGGDDAEYRIGWVDEDRTAAAGQLRAAFAAVPLLVLEDAGRDAALAQMEDGDLRAVVVVPAGTGEALSGGPQASLTVYTDPSASQTSATIDGIVRQVVNGTNLAVTGRPPALAVATESLQTDEITAAAYFVPSILAMALMQLGVFSAIPLVQQRENHILKRLSATPLPRWTLVGSNVVTRLVIAAVQTVLIVGIGYVLFDVRILGSPLLVALIVVLGSSAFIALGYVIASFAPTEDAANGLTSIVQFPLMFLSGIFFPLEFMPEALRYVAYLLPLTYLGDALRQVMVGGSPLVPLAVGLAILAGWLAAALAVSARFFRWT